MCERGFFFSLISSDWIILKFLSNSQIISSDRSILLLIALLPFIFLSLYFSAIEFLLGSFLNKWFYLFVKLLIFFEYCFFKLYWIVLLCFLVVHWVSLKLLFWIFYQVNRRSLCLWNQVMEDYWDPLVVPFCLIFHVLEVFHSCLLIWSSIHLFQPLLTALGREIPSREIFQSC